MILTSLDNEFEEPGRRPNLWNGEGLDREEAYDDGDDESVKIICQESCFDAADKSVKNDADRKQKGCRDNMHSGAEFTHD